MFRIAASVELSLRGRGGRLQIRFFQAQVDYSGGSTWETLISHFACSFKLGVCHLAYVDNMFRIVSNCELPIRGAVCEFDSFNLKLILLGDLCGTP